VPADDKQAVHYYRMACDADEPDACTALGQLARRAR
jgi:TPR repeat protein